MAENIVPMNEPETVPAEVIRKGKEVKKLYREVETAAKKVIEKAYDLGALLLDLQADFGHGGFMAYCTDQLGLNYKMCQRYMDVAKYRPQIEADTEDSENVIDFTTALKEANKLKKAEADERREVEEKMFQKYLPKDEAYHAAIDEAGSADDMASVVKPPTPWSKVEDDKERRNITNRYKAWKKKLQEAEKKSDEDDNDEPPTINEVVDAAFAAAMGKLESFLGEDTDDLETGIAMLIDMLSTRR